MLNRFWEKRLFSHLQTYYLVSQQLDGKQVCTNLSYVGVNHIINSVHVFHLKSPLRPKLQKH